MFDKNNMRSEANVSNDAAIAFSNGGGKSFRNNVGSAWSGVKVKEYSEGGKRYIVLKAPRRIKFGLMEGSADRIGWLPVKITQAMVGSTIAQFTSMEMKKLNGRATPAQVRWHEIVLRDGGLSGFVRCKEDVLSILAGDRINP